MLIAFWCRGVTMGSNDRKVARALDLLRLALRCQDGDGIRLRATESVLTNKAAVAMVVSMLGFPPRSQVTPSLNENPLEQ